MDRAAIVAHARESIRRGSKSFAAASKLFDRETRERAWLLYAWCRACDDIMDGQDHGRAGISPGDPLARLAEIRTRTDHALAGYAGDDPCFAALALTMRECSVPDEFVEHVLAGFALDAQGWWPETTDDLLRYCYHVAGAVGCMMAVVMGVSPQNDAVLDRACDLGIAFQLANIARDVGDDARMGRCYLPRIWLAEQGIDPLDPMAAATRPALALLAGRLADMAATYEASARMGTAMLPFRSAWAVLSAAGIYGALGRKVRTAGVNAWDRRIVTSRSEKLYHVTRAAASAIVRSRHGSVMTSREEAGLWSRPSLRCHEGEG